MPRTPTNAGHARAGTWACADGRGAPPAPSVYASPILLFNTSCSGGETTKSKVNPKSLGIKQIKMRTYRSKFALILYAISVVLMQFLYAVYCISVGVARNITKLKIHSGRGRHIRAAPFAAQCCPASKERPVAMKGNSPISKTADHKYFGIQLSTTVSAAVAYSTSPIHRQSAWKHKGPAFADPRSLFRAVSLRPAPHPYARSTNPGSR